MDEQRTIFKLISLLLDYPDPRWPLAELRETGTALTGTKTTIPLNSFFDYLGSHDCEQLNINYVQTFDFNPATTLNLTYLDYGDDHERGHRLADLLTHYDRAGYRPATGELPDYLPLVLEFAAEAPVDMAREVLGEQLPAITQLQAKLAQADSPYAGIMEVCLDAVAGFVHAEGEEWRLT